MSSHTRTDSLGLSQPARLPHATAAILSIGDELVLGQTLNSNSKWLAARLAELGIATREHVTVPDDLESHVAAIRRLATSVDIVISSGGLGPTLDDLTREAMAKVCGEPLIEDADSLAQIQAYFRVAGRTMADNNRIQALRPKSATALRNSSGTAPGIFATIHATMNADASSASVPRLVEVACLPGPPSELMPMFDAEVVPQLRLPTDRRVLTRAVPCFGVGESDLAARLGPLMQRDHEPLVGTTASGGVVTCRIRYEGALSLDEATKRMDATEREVRDRAGPFALGEADSTLPRAAIAALKASRRTLGVVESCTGGLLSASMTDVPGSSAVFVGGLITYANQLKVALAHVDPVLVSDAGPGAVSQQVARAMALGGLDRLNCDDCLAITGIAGPDGATPARDADMNHAARPEKKVGLVYIALARRHPETQSTTVEVRKFQMRDDRAAIRDWSAKVALMMLLLSHRAQQGVTLLREVPLE